MFHDASSARSVSSVLQRARADREKLLQANTVDLYLNLLEQTLTGIILDDPGYLPDINLSAGIVADRERRRVGMDWPLHAQTMVGIARLKNVRACIESILLDDVPGDLIETGVWRGGSCIYMRAILAAYGIADRRVWVADSFEGLPPPDPGKYPIDQGDQLHKVSYLAVSQEEVAENFRRYQMLDDQVRFLKGFFEHSLPNAPIQQLSLIRLDGDMYGSTMDAMNALYHKLSPGGYVIVDDYSLPPCAQAITDYRAKHGVHCPIQDIDGSAVFWRNA